MSAVTREFVSDLRQLSAIRAFVREACRECWTQPSDNDRIADLELAVDEASSNVTLHAYDGAADRPIEVSVDVDNDQVVVALAHCGQQFDPGMVAAPVFDGSRETGFGLYLIRKSVDEVSFLHDGQGHEVIRLVKKRRP